MTYLLYFIGLTILSGVGWVVFKLIPWSGPFAAIAGLALVVISVYMDPTNLRLMGFGAGLFTFSSLIFVASAVSRGQ